MFGILGGMAPLNPHLMRPVFYAKNVTEFAKIVFDAGFLSKTVPRAGSEVVRIPVDPLGFLTGCRKRRLNQARSVLSLSLDLF